MPKKKGNDLLTILRRYGALSHGILFIINALLGVTCAYGPAQRAAHSAAFITTYTRANGAAHFQAFATTYGASHCPTFEATDGPPFATTDEAA